MTEPNEPESGPPYRWAFACGVVVLAIYIATLAPTTAFWDTSEYIAAAKVLGIPHPPGNPLFSILAHTFGLLPVAAGYAKRINLFAAVTSSAAAGLWFLVAERWMRGLVAARGARLAAAFAGILIGATSWTVWNQSTVNEKVYTVSLLSTALVMWLVVHWSDDKPGPHRDRWLILIAYIIALSSTNHSMGLLAAPAVAIYVLFTDWRVITRWQVVLGVLLAAAIGVSLNYLFLPIRAAQFPAINEGEPVGFFSPALRDVLNRVQYGKPSVFDRQADLPWQFANYLQYWSWQFARDWTRLANAAAALFTVIGLTGLVAMLRRDRRAGLAALALLGTVTVALIFYLNFKYGFSIRADEGEKLNREVRERDYFFICSFAYFGTLVAVGLGTAMQGVVDWLSDWRDNRSRWLAASPVLALALIPMFGNHLTASRAEEYAARDFAIDLLESIEPYGILITAGDNDTFPLWYAQEVEGVRRDVTLANLSLMNTEWHNRQIRRRVIPDFDPSRSIDLWKPRGDVAGVALGKDSVSSWRKPASPVFTMTERQLDSLPEYVRVQQGQGVMVDSLRIEFGQDILDRKDLVTTFLIKDNLGKRPIYFSWSDGGYPDQTLGLSQYLVTQGMARKLMPTPVKPGGDIVLGNLGYTDLRRTNKLMWDAYHWRSMTRHRPRGWVDLPSASILSLYQIVYGGMAGTLRAQGDTVRAARADSIAKAVDGVIKGKH